MTGAEVPERSAVQEALAAWQRAHPAATLAEIEQEVDRQLAGVRALLIGEVAAAGGEAERPDCPACARPMHRDRARTVRQATAHGGTVELRGQTWRCPACGAGLFPPR